MTNILTPTPKQKFFDNNGRPANGYQLFTYSAGTSTKAATYPDADSTGPGQENTNPIILDFRGECDLWIPPNVAYKYVLANPSDTDPPTNPIWTVDDVVSDQLLTLYGGVDTGSANAYVLNFIANFSTYTDGIVIYWIPSSTNTAGSTVNVNGLGPVNILNQDGTALTAGQIQSNQIVQMMYKGAGFLLVGAPISGSFTVTLTGVSGAAVTGTARWTKDGRAVQLVLPALSGTSNSTVKTYTGLPAALVPAFNVYAVTTGVNNSGAAQEVISISIAATGNVISFARLTSDGLWTASGVCSVSGGTLNYQT
ncbi:MAG TPA: hypothetical protein VGN16_04015 [Acidobacteriaceae bacterium]